MDGLAPLKINMLGSFSLVNGDVVLTDRSSRSRKAWSLLEYLITFRSREIPQNDIIELLWPDDDITEPANTLKTLLHRLRAILAELRWADGKDMILAQRGSYAWNNELPVVIDAEEFERRAEAAFDTEDKAARLELLLSAIELYKGDFLPKSALETWVIPINTYYHSLYLKSVHAAVSVLEETARFPDIIAICQRAVILDPYDEELHRALIEAYILSGNQQAAMQHYNHVTELFMEQFGITPSPELTALYKNIVKTSNTTEMNLHVIRDELRERESLPGAFFCEYEFFKDIYRLQARAIVRSGQAVHIALMTVMNSSGPDFSQKKMSATMERLRDVIAVSLRRGDVFTRYSVTQYLIMLPSTTLESSDFVLQRVCRNFRSKYPHMNALLHYTALPMDVSGS